MCVHVCVYVGQGSILSVTLSGSQTFFLRQGLSVGLELRDLSRLANEKAPACDVPVFSSPPLSYRALQGLLCYVST